MPSLGKFVQSKDGTRIWTHAAGNPAKPAVVFIPGFSCTALAFEKQFDDPKLLENLYLVSTRRTAHLLAASSAIPFTRSATTLAGRVRVVSLSKKRTISRRDTPMTSRLSSMNTNSSNLSSADGTFSTSKLMMTVLTPFYTHTQEHRRYVHSLPVI